MYKIFPFVIKATILDKLSIKYIRSYTYSKK